MSRGVSVSQAENAWSPGPDQIGRLSLLSLPQPYSNTPVRNPLVTPQRGAGLRRGISTDVQSMIDPITPKEKGYGSEDGCSSEADKNGQYEVNDLLRRHFPSPLELKYSPSDRDYTMKTGWCQRSLLHTAVDNSPISVDNHPFLWISYRTISETTTIPSVPQTQSIPTPGFSLTWEATSWGKGFFHPESP